MPAVASLVISVRIVISGASKYPKPTAMIMVESRCKGFKSFLVVANRAAPKTAPSNAFPFTNGSNEAALIVTAVAAAVVVGSGIINPTVVLFVWFVVVYRCREESRMYQSEKNTDVCQIWIRFKYCFNHARATSVISPAN